MMPFLQKLQKGFSGFISHIQESLYAFSRFIFAKTPVIPNDTESNSIAVFDTPDATIKSLVGYVFPSLKIGLYIILAAFLFFFVWGSFAPLSSASAAMGVVMLSDHHKTIQHLEGGIITHILVKDGDMVQKDQELIRLNDTATRAQASQIKQQLITLLAMENRLMAERDNEDVLAFSEEVMESIGDDPKIAESITTQEQLFISRRNALLGSVTALEQRILQHDEKKRGLEAQKSSIYRQTELLTEETNAIEELYAKGLAVKSRLLEFRRRQEDLDGRLGGIIAEVSNNEEAIAEARINILNVKNEYVKEASRELEKVQAQILELRERFRAAQDVLDRAIIRAPIGGVVANLAYHTIGGVIGHGQTIMDIVPQNDALIIEAMVNPNDIDTIALGMEAKVNLSAYKARLVPRLEGKVIYISPDTRKGNQQNPQSFYVVRVEVPAEAFSKLRADVKLYPGMQAEVYIVTGHRTFLQYLISPLRDSFYQAMIED